MDLPNLIVVAFVALVNHGGKDVVVHDTIPTKSISVDECRLNELPQMLNATLAAAQKGYVTKIMAIDCVELKPTKFEQA